MLLTLLKLTWLELVLKEQLESVEAVEAMTGGTGLIRSGVVVALYIPLADGSGGSTLCGEWLHVEPPLDLLPHFFHRMPLKRSAGGSAGC